MVAGYQPSAWGARYHATPHDHVLGAGSAGPGKSTVLVADPLQQVMVEHARCKRDPRVAGVPEGGQLFQLIDENPMRWGYSTGQAIHFRRKLTMLGDTLRYARQLYKAADPNCKISTDSSGTVLCSFKSGYRVKFTHMKDPDDWETHFGSAYTHISYDEANQFEENQVDQVNTRLRSDDPVLMRMLRTRYMSNPTQLTAGMEDVHISNPLWLRERFVDPWPRGEKTFRRTITLSDGSTRDETWIYLPARLSDNPNKAFRLEYEFKLRTAKEHIRKALLEGDWYVSAGSFFAEEWDNNYNVCQPFRIPDGWPQFRSMDWGFKTPGAIGWYAIDDDGNLYRHRELRFKGKPAHVVAEEVRAIEEGLGLWRGARSGITGPADTQLWEQRGERGRSKAAEFADKGVLWERADKRSRQRNAERVAERLKDRRGGRAGLIFFANCKSAIRTIPSIGTSATNPNEPAKGGDDHDYDEVSYACAHASRNPRSVGRSRYDMAGRAPYDYDDEPEVGRDWGAGYGVR